MKRRTFTDKVYAFTNTSAIPTSLHKIKCLTDSINLAKFSQMEIYNIHHAKTHLSKLIERVRKGEEITICKAGEPVAKLVPIYRDSEPRCGGQWRGRVKIADDFDELPEEIAAAFRGGTP